MYLNEQAMTENSRFQKPNARQAHLFYLDWIYYPLLSGIVATVAIFFPGLILMIQHKNSKNV